MEEMLWPLLVSFSLGVLFTPLTIKFAKQIHLLDDPKKHRHPAIIHHKPVPRGGGIPLLLSIVFTSIIFLPTDRIVMALLLGGIMAVAVGVLDDKFDLSPYLRFATNIIVAALPVFLGGIKISFVTNPFGGILHFNSFPMIPELLTVVWIVWTMNMLNWSKGVDGQMPGTAAIAALTIGILSLRFYPLTLENLTTAKLSFITAGAALGFLLFNIHPARIFPGYGATILGYLLAITSVLGGAKLATAILVMGIPTIDGVFTIARRLAAGRSPFKGDRGHFHHLLLSRGFGQRTVAFLYWVFSAILGVIALNLSSKEKFFAILALVIVVGGAILWLSSLEKEQKT